MTAENCGVLSRSSETRQPHLISMGITACSSLLLLSRRACSLFMGGDRKYQGSLLSIDVPPGKIDVGFLFLRSICHFCSTNKPRTNHTQRSKVFYDAHARTAVNRRSCSASGITPGTNTLQAAQTRKNRQTSPCSARVPWKAFPPLRRSVCEPFSSLVPSLARSLKTPAPGIAPSRRRQKRVCS